MKTKVIFLIEKASIDTDIFTPVNEINTGEVFAFFPEDRYNDFEPKLRTSYAHLGQHSSCHIDYANECKEANYNEYADLLKELISIGYTNLEVLNNQECEAHRKPTKGEINFGYGATHYRTFPVTTFLKKNGELKIRIKATDDGLIYSRI